MKGNAELEEDDSPDVPNWCNEVETIEVLHKRISTGGENTPDEFRQEQMPDHLVEAIEDGEVTRVQWEAGDEIPVPIAARCWDAFNDRLATYDRDGEQLDTVARIERMDFDTGVLTY